MPARPILGQVAKDLLFLISKVLFKVAELPIWQYQWKTGVPRGKTSAELPSYLGELAYAYPVAMGVPTFSEFHKSETQF